MIEKTVLIGPDIPGTFTVPAQRKAAAAILLLAGSGPVDQNGNGPKGKFQSNLYRDLAHFFARSGFAALRYDKRGTGSRSGSWMEAGLSDLLEDARAAYDFLLQQPEVSGVIVCGHSEGTILATEMAATMNPAGCMLLSGGVDNLMEALAHQRQQAYEELFARPGLKSWVCRTMKIDVKSERKVANLMMKIKATNKPTIKVQGFVTQPAKWLREHDGYNARKALARVTCPVFALQGDKDALVNNEVLKELPLLVKGECEYHIVPNMEHSLRPQPEEKSILKTKKRMKPVLERPLHKDGLEKIKKWLEKHFGEQLEET